MVVLMPFTTASKAWGLLGQCFMALKPALAPVTVSIALVPPPLARLATEWGPVQAVSTKKMHQLAQLQAAVTVCSRKQKQGAAAARAHLAAATAKETAQQHQPG